MHFAAFAYVGESVQEPGRVLPQQRRRYARAARGDARAGVRHARVLEHLRDLWRPRPGPDPRGRSRSGRSIRTAPVQARWSSGCSTTSGPRTACARSPCATSTPPAPTRTVRSARITIPRRTSSRSCSTRRSATAARVTIFGTDYPTPDGTAIRDYIHVDRPRRRPRARARSPDAGRRRPQSISAPAGAFSVREVIAAAEQPPAAAFRCARRRGAPGDPPVLVADPARARALLGFAPRFTALAPIVATAWRWHSRPR